MTKESREIEQFWQEREKEYQSTLVIATVANYISGCTEHPGMHGRAVREADDQPGMHGRAVREADDQPGMHGRAVREADDQPGMHGRAVREADDQPGMHGRAVRGADDQLLPVSGLLYILHNGIYFENFPNTSMFSTLFRINEQFIKIRLVFKKENIVSVSCNRPLNFLERLSLFFSAASRQFIITYQHSEHIQNAIFDCMKKPFLLCDAYNSTLE